MRGTVRSSSRCITSSDKLQVVAPRLSVLECFAQDPFGLAIRIHAVSNKLTPASRHRSTSRRASGTSVVPMTLWRLLPTNDMVPKLNTDTLIRGPPRLRHSTCVHLLPHHGGRKPQRASVAWPSELRT